MRRPVWHFIAALLLVLVVPTFAAVTQIPVPPFSIPVGWEVEFTIQHNLPDGNLENNYSGQWRCLACDPPGAWTPDPANTQSVGTFIHPSASIGTQEFRGGVYEETGLAEYAWSYGTAQITVVGPDRDHFSSPQDSNATSDDPLFMEMDVLFYLYAGSLLIGDDVTGIAQERIKREPQFGGTGQWGDWLGPTIGEFELIGEMIWDFKTATVLNRAAWDALPDDTVIDDFYQQNRVILNDCAGQPQTFTFATHHFRKKKTGSTSFQLYEVDP